MLISLIYLNSCATQNFEFCPAWPIAGPKVADEVESIEGKNLFNVEYKREIIDSKTKKKLHVNAALREKKQNIICWQLSFYLLQQKLYHKLYQYLKQFS